MKIGFSGLGGWLWRLALSGRGAWKAELVLVYTVRPYSMGKRSARCEIRQLAIGLSEIGLR